MYISLNKARGCLKVNSCGKIEFSRTGQKWEYVENIMRISLEKSGLGKITQ